MAASLRTTPDVPLWQRLDALEAPLSLQSRNARSAERMADSPNRNKARIHQGLGGTEAFLANSPHPQASLMRLHDARKVDMLGAPELLEAMLVYLDGPGERTPRQRDACAQVLYELRAMHPQTLAMLDDSLTRGLSQEDIAHQAGIRQQRVSECLRAGKQWCRRRYDEMHQ